MKLSYAIFLILLVPFSAAGQKLAGDYELGLGAAYGFEMEEAGANASLYYSYTDDIRLGVELTYFFLSSQEGQKNPSAYELNLNVNYHFVNQEVLRLYALLGVQFAYSGYTYESNNQSMSDSDTGVNLGGGVEFDLESIILYVQPKYTINGFEQVSVSVGGRIYF